ncbi:PAMP-induced secreted peptide 1 [Cardamine amara subsp. amara]|uniref:PAMP-induced secreted peptide 1 n=1 Tax=Cardamine amara subsp. amara TaxID=228776 RepID=A0ABD1A9F5_CARAN
MRRVSWSTVLVVVMMVVLLVVEHVVVPAAAGRVLTEKPGETKATLTVENMKSTVDSWFQRLASGPSPRGRGH